MKQPRHGLAVAMIASAAPRTAVGPASRVRAVVVAAWAASVCVSAPVAAQQIMGRVSDAASGAPLPGATVEIVAAGLTTVTGEGGRYVLSDVPEGGHEIRITSALGVAEQAVIVEAESDWVIDIPIQAGGDAWVETTLPSTGSPGGTGAVRGRVVLPGGHPIQQVLVFVADPRVRTTTDENGLFTMALPPGSHTLGAERIGLTEVAREVTIEAGRVLAADFTLRPVAYPVGYLTVGGAFRDRYQTVEELLGLDAASRQQADPDEPVPPGRVVGRVLDATDAEVLPDVRVSLVGSPFSTESLSSGEYVILNVPPGTYRVRAEGPGLIPVESEVTMGARQVQVDFRMEPGGVGG